MSAQLDKMVAILITFFSGGDLTPAFRVWSDGILNWSNCCLAKKPIYKPWNGGAGQWLSGGASCRVTYAASHSLQNRPRCCGGNDACQLQSLVITLLNQHFSVSQKHNLHKDPWFYRVIKLIPEKVISVSFVFPSPPAQQGDVPLPVFCL